MRFTPFAAGIALLLCTLATPAQPTFTLVARTGQAAPGASATYDALSTPSINANGQVAFAATLAGPAVNTTNSTAIFAGLPAAPSLVVRSDSPAPGEGPGFALGEIDVNSPRLNADGHVLFGAALTGPGIDPNLNATFAYWVAAPAGIRKIVSTQDQDAPYDRPVFTAGDIVAWPANDGVHVATPTDSGADPVGSFGRPVLSPARSVAFLGFLDADRNGAEAIRVGPPGNVRTVVSPGDPAPGFPSGTTFSLPLYPSVNAAGQIAFHALLNVGAAPSETGESVWVGTPGSLGLVASHGATAPGVDGLRYGYWHLDGDDYRTPAISAAGEVAFAVSLIDAQDAPQGSALFAGMPGHVRLVARERQHAPNAPANLDVGELLIGTVVTINRRGQVAFRDEANLYAVDVDGALLLVAGVGLPFQVAPGDIRTIANIHFGDVATGGEDGRSFAFNDAGQLTFGLTFTDNTSAVVFTTVPEPAFATAVSSVGVILIRRRPRRG